MKLKPIDEQVVVVVGATSGIGRATALQFAERGAKLVVAGRSEQALEALVNEIRSRGGRATAVTADVSDYSQVSTIADRAAATYGRIDTWVHLAAVSMYSPFSETKPEEFKRVVDVNLLGQVYGAMAALPYLKREGRGALIHVSSVEARRALPLQSAYAASKHGIPAFLDALRMELEHDGVPISVTNVMPAGINTPLFNKALTRIHVKPRPLPPVYEPDLVAKTIVHVAQHPTREIFAGGAGKGFGLMQRVSPRLGDVTLRKLGFRGQKTDQPKSPQAPNNLFQHIEGYDTIKGDFTQEARSSSLYTWMRTRPVARWAALATVVAAGAALSWRVVQARRKNRSIPERLMDFVKDLGKNVSLPDSRVLKNRG